MLYRVWFARKTTPQYDLVEAESTDECYRMFRPAKRATIYRVERVMKTSEWDAIRAAGNMPPTAPARRR